MQVVDDIAIGIDLGTTYSCVAVFESDTQRVRIIQNVSDFTTPSVVSFDDEKSTWLVGEEAKKNDCINPKNTFYEVKRLIGRNFSDKNVQEDIKRWPFSVCAGEGNGPHIMVEQKKKLVPFRPEQISSKILEKMKEVAESYLQKRVTKAVITVPAYFNDSQRKATQDAGTLAGLNVIRIINEPTAAAMAYGFDKNITKESNILIFDLGGGTFDVSLLMLDETGTCEVLATSGNTHLGGTDFTNRLVDHCLKAFKTQHNIDLKSMGEKSTRAMQRLKNQCENIKRVLSEQEEVEIELDLLFNGLDFKLGITRQTFESLNEDLFQGCFHSVDQVLSDAKITKTKVDEVIIVGGSTRIPKIQSLLRKYFEGKILNQSINPDEAIAYGAAIQAAILSGVKDDKLKDMVLFDVTPLSLGIEVKGGIMVVLVKRNTSIPIKKKQIFTTSKDNQTSVVISVYEGERSIVTENQKLDEFHLGPIPSLPQGEASISVCFEIDTNGILGVSASDNSPGSAGANKRVVIKNEGNRLTAQKIAEIIIDAERNREEDLKKKERIEKVNKFEKEMNDFVKEIFKDPDLTLKESQQLRTVVNEINLWLKNNHDATSDDLQNQKKKFKAQAEGMLKKLGKIITFL